MFSARNCAGSDSSGAGSVAYVSPQRVLSSADMSIEECASRDEHIHGGGSLFGEKACARVDGRRRGANVVDEQDTAAVDPSSRAQCKGSADVSPALRLVEADLGRGAA
jgi:hypothetical protein